MQESIKEIERCRRSAFLVATKKNKDVASKEAEIRAELWTQDEQKKERKRVKKRKAVGGLYKNDDKCPWCGVENIYSPPSTPNFICLVNSYRNLSGSSSSFP